MKKLLLFAFLAFSVSMLTAQTNKWTGEVNNDWFVPGNWSMGTVPEKQSIVVPETGKGNVILSGGTSYLKDVTIENGAGIIIMPDGALIALGVVTNNGDFIIHSDASGQSGKFIDNGTLLGTGHFSFLRDIGPTYPNYTDERGWHYIGPPISPFGGEDILDLFTNLWDEPNSMWQHVEGSTPCTPADYTWSPLEGLSIKLDQSYNCPTPGTGGIIDFNGNFTDLHTGPKSGNYTAEGSMSEHWNLMANPYPSVLQASKMVFPPSLNEAVYMWDGDKATCKSYVGGVGDEFIAPTQGFFVSAISNGTLTVDNSMRSYWGNWHKEENIIPNLFGLQLSGNDYEDITYVRFLQESTNNFDRDWDAYKCFANNDEVPQIYTVSNDFRYSILSRPTASVIPVSVICGVNGTYTIEAIEANDIENVTLEDLFTGDEINILEESYTFNYSVNDEASRFLLHFNTLGTGSQLDEITRIYSESQQIHVNLPKMYSGEIIVFNMMGQEVSRNGIVQGLNTIPINKNNTYYIVQIITNEETISRKVFVK